MSFIDEVKQKVKSNIKTIVLPEATDVRVLKAAQIVQKEQFAKVVLIGNNETVEQIAKQNNIDILGIDIVNPEKSDKYDEYVNKFYELRKEKGMTIDKAKELIKDEVYFGMMMVKQCDADGLVSGAIHSSADTLRPALQILKTAPNTKLVSTFFLICTNNSQLENKTFVFSDCALIENPDSEQLSEIAISSAKTFENLVDAEPKVGMLSYSTYGSAKSELTDKVINATALVKSKAPNLKVDGELQLDAAIIPEIGQMKAKGSKIAGYCNTLIFPDINAGNIGYKLVQRFGNAEAYGPLCQGIAKPVNDLSRGCSSDDIVGTVALTALQAQLV